MLCPPRAIHRGGLGSKPLECHAEERQCLHVGSEARCDLTPASSFSCISRPRLRSALRGGPLGALAHVLCGAPSDSRSRSRPECSFTPCAPLCWGFYCNFFDFGDRPPLYLLEPCPSPGGLGSRALPCVGLCGLLCACALRWAVVCVVRAGVWPWIPAISRASLEGVGRGASASLPERRSCPQAPVPGTPRFLGGVFG